MSISAPSNPRGRQKQSAAKLIVLLGPTDGSAPSVDDEVDYLIPQRIGIYANGGRDDVMTFNYDLKKSESRLIDTTTPVGYHRQIEVRMLDEDDEPTRVLAWGFIARQPQTINDASEKVEIEARLDQHVFGGPLTDYPTWDTVSDAQIDVQRGLVFNPEIDEEIKPNCSDKQHDLADPEDEDDFYYVLDPESARTTPARFMQDQTPGLWTLPRAVHMLCWHLNPDEDYIKNPSLEDLEDVLSDRDDLIKNVDIPFGLWLPAALDALLIPAEYGWQLVHSLNSDDERETRMRFYKRGSGITKQLHMQRPGETKDLKGTNVDEFSATYSIVDLANRIECYGDYVKKEDTFELVKGWSDDDDSLDLAALEKDQPDAIAKPFVGRKWILNEAGDYNDTRTEITEAFDLSDVFDITTPYRRRKFERCLSQHTDADDKESNGYRVDWFNHNAAAAAVAWSSTLKVTAGQVVSYSSYLYLALADSLNSAPPGASWQEIGWVAVSSWDSGTTYNDGDQATYSGIRYRAKNGPHTNYIPPSSPNEWENMEADLVGGAWQKVKWPFSVLEKECGILFEGPTPPDALWNYMLAEPEKARVRITATVRGDSRLTGIATRRSQSPNGLNIALVLNVRDKFQNSEVRPGSLFASSASIARNDQTAINTYAETVRNIEDAAQVGCSIRLEGVDHDEYQIGDLIDKVDGRNLSLDGYVASAGSVTPRRPQVIGFNYLVAGGQRVELLLESFKQERPEV